jgi:HPt (histidine-containing phosphotransfer) domain-containing protein
MKTIPGERIVVKIDGEIRGIIPDFFEFRIKDIKAIRDALTSRNYDAIMGIGHKMKGSGGSYGFDAIYDIGAKLEQKAADGDAQGILDCVAELEDYLERVDVVYD